MEFTLRADELWDIAATEDRLKFNNLLMKFALDFAEENPGLREINGNQKVMDLLDVAQAAHEKAGFLLMAVEKLQLQLPVKFKFGPRETITVAESEGYHSPRIITALVTPRE